MSTQALDQVAFTVQPICCKDLSILQQNFPSRYPHLLSSVAQGQLGRFDILFAFAQQRHALTDPADADDFVQAFEQEFAQQTPPLRPEAIRHLPFYGGWMAYFSYEYAQVIEPSLQLAQSSLPLAVIERFPAAIIIDHQQQQCWCLAESDGLVDAESCLQQMQADLAFGAEREAQDSASAAPLIHALRVEEEEAERFVTGVERIKDYILSGDVFQVNLSRTWQIELADDTSVYQVYRALSAKNPAPFACLVNLAEGSIISSSPERLVRHRDAWVDTRPIAGTRKRSDCSVRDQALIEELISHPKERAEHIMLIDLERNDLGRICQPGTVEVDELMVVESYEHVHHIVSNVRGRPQQGMTPLQMIHAVFPGGTITGCPKIRCMEIVAELEQGAREAYTGSLGYINRDGSMDLNILIRSFIQQGEQLRFRAGAGIVADSIAEAELKETRHKAKGLLRALAGYEGL